MAMDEVSRQQLEQEELTLALLHTRAEVARLQEREQLFSTLLGSVNAVLWAFDWDAQRVIYVSPAYERIFGRSTALLLAGYEEWRNSIYPDDLDYAAESLAQVLETGAVEAREYRIIRAGSATSALSAVKVRRVSRISSSASPRTSPRRSSWKASCTVWPPPMC